MRSLIHLIFYLAALSSNAQTTGNWFRAIQGSSAFSVPEGVPTLTPTSAKILNVTDGDATDNDGWFGRQSVVVKNGIAIRSVREGSAHHIETYGVVHFSFSNNYGLTWTALDTYIDGSPVVGAPMRPANAGAPSANARGPSHGILTLCPNGDILCQMWSSDYGNDNDGAHQSRSTDGGHTWSNPARINISGLPVGTNANRVFFGEGYTIKGNTIYAPIRYYAVSSPQTERNGVATSIDNGYSWNFLSWVTSTSDPSPRGTQEMSIEYVGGDRFISFLREAANQDGHFSYSLDNCVTWSAPVDITNELGIGLTSWLGRQILMTRAHLKQQANWWDDRVLILTGFQGGTDNQSTGARRNAAWVGIIPVDYNLANISWYGPYWLADEGYDGGYGCPFYNPLTGEYVQLSYRSPTGFFDASATQCNFTLTFE